MKGQNWKNAKLPGVPTISLVARSNTKKFIASSPISLQSSNPSK